MSPTVAIVGMACRYPDARSPVELWENVLAQRRAFRRLPPERLRLDDYLSADRSAPDRTYAGEAALIEGYEFDRINFRVAGSTFRSADLTHWLALDVASEALADAGFPDADGLPRETTGVLLGNTLTGEFSRANGMRLRWPYVRRVVEAALVQAGWMPEQRHHFFEVLEASYKAPFAPVGEETLAGALSNTIAGRICNHFDLKGSGYTVDGACASSLLAVTTACSALVAGDLDVALAGGVDVSLDPFELVGFAKAGALAPEEMRIYDARSAGFWPGEGCGFVVLMRHEDAVAQGRRIYAVIRGWGVSSDGRGGITRPEVEGQILALHRAYRRAGFGIETVAYFEGHGTGTAVGDLTELQVLSRARREATPKAPPAVIGSIKANIGHTKAAAGVAGLIKATMALHAQILPPTTGCEAPHPELTVEAPALRVLSEGEPWPFEQPLRAGVSAMGFGGINTHIAIEEIATDRRKTLSSRERTLLSSAQDAELFLIAAQDVESLRQQVDHLSTFAARLSRAELADLASQLSAALTDRQTRAAVVASNPRELADRLKTLTSWLTEGVPTRLAITGGVFLGGGLTAPRIGFLFPGQGSPSYLDGGAWRRFEAVKALYARMELPAESDGNSTAVAQPAIVTASLAGLQALEGFGLTASVAVGHSLGELTALYWAGPMDEASLLRIATARGKAMAELRNPTGAMASIGAGQQEVEDLLDNGPVVIAGLNSPHRTVVSGEATAVAKVVFRARGRGLNAVILPVSHAFHSPLVAAAAPTLAEHLSHETFRQLRRIVISTVTGAPLGPDEDLRALLYRQVTSPVRFTEAMAAAAREGVDLFVEVGPGAVLSGLVAECMNTPVVALDAGGPSLKGLLRAVGAAFALGAPIRHEAFFAQRFTRPFNLDWAPRFFVSPCELAPVSDSPVDSRPGLSEDQKPQVRPLTGSQLSQLDPESLNVERDSALRIPQRTLELVRQLVAERAELPLSSVKDASKLLGDLHLNSIAVSQLVAEAARRLALPPPVAPTDYAGATVAEVAQALEELARTGGSRSIEGKEQVPSGVDSWIRTFTVELVERPLPRLSAIRDPRSAIDVGAWRVIAPPNHPLKEPLEQAFAGSGRGGGVVVCLPPDPDERHVGLLLEGARAVLGQHPPGRRRPRAGEATYLSPPAGEGADGCSRFVLVQHGGGAAGFARTLHLETPEVTTCVVNVPVDHPKATEWVLAEARTAVGYSEAHYDASGRRREPVLRLLPLREESADLPFGPNDVLLVTGGGKGIAAECALSLACETGVRLALLGRSRPAADPDLAANLERIAAAGVDFRYIATDVVDMDAVQTAVREVESTLGSVTAILHGAGTNVPQLLRSLDEAAFRRTLLPKVQGLRNLLAAINPDRLRILVSFGSIIARTGMRGEADYAVANEWLSRLTERWQAEHPHCRCVALEWSVWSGVGMGQRLGRVDALMREGITPISSDAGISILRRLVAQSLPAASVVVTGRFGDPPTLKVERPELPFLRFLERPRVYYPGVELVVDAELSGDTDPYLDDHVFHGERLLPAVIGLEAIAQVAMALEGSSDPPVFENVQFTRPIVIPDGGRVTIRVASLVRTSGHVDVVLRSSETAFQVDHFHATCLFGRREREVASPGIETVGPETEAIPLLLNPDRDLYGTILFQGGRFRRLCGYRRLQATECVAEIAPDDPTAWFGQYLPATLVLGDPGARDAAIHAIQACIPHATLLPIAVDRLAPGTAHTPGPWFVHARERSREGDTFVYDVEVTGTHGSVQERWEGLRLRKVADMAPQRAWVAPLLGPYIERRLRELIPGSAVSVAVTQESETKITPSPLEGEGGSAGGASRRLDERVRTGRRVASDWAIQQALGAPLSIRRRPDGRPEVAGHQEVELSAAHAGELTLAVAGPGPIACDLEPVVAKPAFVWQDLLGPERFALVETIAKEAGEDVDTAAARVWAAAECLKKAGAPINAPLRFVSSLEDGWVRLSSRSLTIVTAVAPTRGVEGRVVLAVLTRNDDPSVRMAPDNGM